MTAPSPERAIHLRPSMLAVVAVGGAVGTAAREALTLAIPTPTGALPVAILAINLLGAFVLGALLEALLRSGPDVGRRRLARLGLGTGFCGGFTTYSTLAAGAVGLHGLGHDGLAVAYALGSVVLGAGAAWAGILVGSRR